MAGVAGILDRLENMSHFVTDLDVRRHTDGSTDGRGTWMLLAPLKYCSDELYQLITVPAGFITDFASVPRIPVAFLLTADAGHAAAVIHDWAYTTHFVSRAKSDALFREALRSSGEPAWRVWLMWLGVRIGGSRPYESAGQRQSERVQAELDAP
jgi:hypothetical protein